MVLLMVLFAFPFFGCLEKDGKTTENRVPLQTENNSVFNQTIKPENQSLGTVENKTNTSVHFNNTQEFQSNTTIKNESSAGAMDPDALFPEENRSSTCWNNKKNSNESDVDCGGVCTVKCADGRACDSNEDCAASNCVSGACQKVPGAPNAYADYKFYNIEKTDKLEMYITWLDRPDDNVGIYAAFTFSFEAGQGGYMGIQRDGSLAKDRAIFSIWSIDNEKQTAECTSSGFNSSDLIRCGKLTHERSGEGNFGQALGMYDWKTGREYRLRIESAGTDSSGEFWRGTIKDMYTNVTTEIGTIHLDNAKGYEGYGKLKTSPAVFLEYYYGHSGYCDENNVHSKVKWRGPYIDGKIADKGYTWYPIKCMYTRQFSPRKGIVVQEAGGKTAWENNAAVFWE